MKKILCALLSLMLLASIAMTAYADNYYTTSVTYDISTGKATLLTQGIADKNKEVTHIVYNTTNEGAKPDKNTILFVDQTTASDTDGFFEFSYSVAAEKMNVVDTATAIVGTDGSEIPLQGSNTSTTEIEGACAVTVTVGEGVTVTINNKTTINNTGVIYAAPNEEIDFSLKGAEKYTYTKNSDAAVTVNSSACKISFTTDSTLAFAAVVEDEFDFESNWTQEGTSQNEIEYNTVITVDLATPIAPDDFVAPQSTLGGDVDLSKIKTEKASQVSVISNIAPAAIKYNVEFGIIFTTKDIKDDDFEVGTENVYKLTAHAWNAEGKWGINIIGPKADMKNYKTRTYVYANDVYKYGNIVTYSKQ